MKIQAIIWAFKQRVKPAGAKFVLVTLAIYADESRLSDIGHHPGRQDCADQSSLVPAGTEVVA